MSGMGMGEPYGGIADTALERRIDEALSTAPEIVVPNDFAARVTSALPEARDGSLAPSHDGPRYGRAAVLLCGVLLAIVLLALAPGVRHEPRWLVMLLSIELVGLSLGAGSWRRSLGWPA